MESLLLPRLVEKKNFRGNITRIMKQTTLKTLLYTSDPFHTLIHSKWRHIIAVFVLSYTLSWTVFGTLYYTAAHGISGPDCFVGVYTYAEAFILSVETQSTVGFGGRTFVANCVGPSTIFSIQCLLAILLDAAFLGLVFAKVSRGTTRGNAIVFSASAVVHLSDGKRVLSFRVVDSRKHQLIEAHVRAYLYYNRQTAEGEYRPDYCTQLKIRSPEVLLMLPVYIEHEIDEASPLHNKTLDDLKEMCAEIVILVEGIEPSTSMTIQARHSYVANEIKFGYRFQNMSTRNQQGRLEVDLSLVNEIQPCNI